MNSGIVFLIVFWSLVLAVLIVVAWLKLSNRSYRVGQLRVDGAALTESHLELPGFLWLSVVRFTYADIESVERLPFAKGVISLLLFRYGISTRLIFTRLFQEIVVIKLKAPSFFKYVMITPRNAAAFVEQLQSRLRRGA